MDERTKLVLNAIIKDYIANAEPVGSRAVAKKYGLGVSPATIRNEMSDLEEEGYIERRSCGMDKRVLRLYPTEKTLALLPGIGEVMESWEKLLVEELTEAEQQALETMLLRLRDSAMSAGKGEEE